jgi:uncharacterized protein (DUF1330 family)
MPVYLIIEIAVKDRKLYEEYVAKVPAIIEGYGGKYLARGGRVTPLMGGWSPERIILIKFESIEKVRSCFQSKEYLEIAPLREQSTTARSIIIEGYPPDDISGRSSK